MGLSCQFIVVNFKTQGIKVKVSKRDGVHSRAVLLRAWGLKLDRSEFESCPLLTSRAALGRLLPIFRTVLPDQQRVGSNTSFVDCCKNAKR